MSQESARGRENFEPLCRQVRKKKGVGIVDAVADDDLSLQ